jgi:hypothetical protein
MLYNMKKLIILFLLIGQILHAQTFIKPAYFQEKLIAYKYISVTDSLKAGYLVLAPESTRPPQPRINLLMNYNGTLERYNGSTWVGLGSSYTLPSASTTVKGGSKIGLYVQMTGDSIGIDTTNLKIWLLTETVGSSNKLQGSWDTTSIKALFNLKENVIQKSPGYLVWNGVDWTSRNEAYLKLNDTTNFLDKADTSGYKVETKTSNAIKLGAKADTSVVNDTTYAIRQTVNTKLSSVSHDITLTGTGTALNPLKVDTSLIATKDFVKDTLLFALTGKKDSMGLWSAAANLYPSTSVLQGQYWVISAPGKLGGTDSVFIGDLIIAKIDEPGQTTSNWIINSAASVGVTVTGQKFNSSTKGVLLYNGRTPLAGTLHGGRAAPVGMDDTLNVNGNLFTSGRIQGNGTVQGLYLISTSYSRSSFSSSVYPATIYSSSTNNSWTLSNATNATKTRFCSNTISSTVWNTTPTAVSERHTYRQTVDVISGTSPVSYLNFGFFKDAGTELIASRLGMTGDWSHLLGANTDYLTSYTGGTVSTPVTDNKRFSATSTGFDYYNYTSGNWSRIMDLSNTGRLTITGGLRCDSSIMVGNDTVALKSDLEGIKPLLGTNLRWDGDTIKLQDGSSDNYISNDQIKIYTNNTNGLNMGSINESTTSDIIIENKRIDFSVYSHLDGDNSASGFEMNQYFEILFKSLGHNGTFSNIVLDSARAYLFYNTSEKQESSRIITKGEIQDLIYQHYDTLESTTTVITYNAAVNPFRTDTIGESHTYHINGAVNGMSGQLNVTITSPATLTFPSGVLADGQTFTSLAAGVYNVCWEKIQNTFNYNIKKYNTYTP